MSASRDTPSPNASRPGELAIETLSEADGLTLVLLGELDLASAPAFAQALHVVEGAGGRIVLDLSQLGFIDSTGIHALLQAEQRLGSRLSLRRGTKFVQRVLELTGVADHFSYDERQDGAVPAPHASPAPSPKSAIGGRPAASPSG